MKLFNTLTMQKEEFVPLEPKKVKMYSCGPTVYNYFHIGNARPFIIFDTLRNYFEYRGYSVEFVQNFTDIDDKVINKANEEGTTFDVIAERYIKEYFVDAKGLGVREATHHPKATDCMDEIIEIVSDLVEKGYAYAINGDVYFRTLKFKDYGKLSHQPLEDLEIGARIEANTQKEHPMDFVLWKNAKPNEPSWTSPWGEGRPGWHIECSAMSRKYLGNQIDIHSGGKDLAFPHHENEIAQSECANGCEFAKYWVHNGFLTVDNEKMSKSKGNFFMVREASEVYGYEAIRMFMLSAHYRSPLNYSEDSLKQGKASLERIYNCIENLDFKIKNSENDLESDVSFEKYKEKFIEALDDDLNTADAVGVIFELVREINTIAMGENPNKNTLISAKNVLNELCSVLNIANKGEEKSLDSDIEALIEQRNEARKNKDFALSDKIRDDLLAKGIVLKDTPQGVTWSYSN
ncbi:MAG: cysteine--tRNA ligase [Clostridia bacterium]